MASGNHQGGKNSVSQVDRVSGMAPACQLCGSVGGRAQKRNSGLCQHFYLGKSGPLALTMMADTQSLYVSAAPVLEIRRNESK